MFEFSPDRFCGDPREKDLEPIFLDVIDQTDSARKFLFGVFLDADLLEFGKPFFKASDFGRNENVLTLRSVSVSEKTYWTNQISLRNARRSFQIKLLTNRNLDA